MVHLDTTNGHNAEVINNFNKVAKYFDGSELLLIILSQWCDDNDLADITRHLDELREENDIVDLFEAQHLLPIEVQELLNEYAEADEDYEVCAELLAKVEALGYTFEFYLDAVPFNLRKKDLVVTD